MDIFFVGMGGWVINCFPHNASVYLLNILAGKQERFTNQRTSKFPSGKVSISANTPIIIISKNAVILPYTQWELWTRVI